MTLHGTFAPNKGQLGVLEVAHELRHYDDIKFLLVGATEGLEDYNKQLYEYMNTYKLHNKVLLFFKNPFVDLFYGSTDLHISNTQQTESFGLTLIEAMSFGAPVVAPDLQGMSAIVSHNKTGFLFPPKDIKALTKLILNVRNNRDTVTRTIGNNGRDYVEKTYTLDIVMQKMEEALVHALPFR